MFLLFVCSCVCTYVCVCVCDIYHWYFLVSTKAVIKKVLSLSWELYQLTSCYKSFLFDRWLGYLDTGKRERERVEGETEREYEGEKGRERKREWEGERDRKRDKTIDRDGDREREEEIYRERSKKRERGGRGR